MCVSVSRGIPVDFSDTVLYGAEVSIDGQTRHVLGYQNKAQTGGAKLSLWTQLASLLQRDGDGHGNAMILPFPAVPGTMTAANVLDTSRCRRVLQDMAAAVKPSAAFGGYARRALSAGRVQVFEAAGIYTVVLADDARDIPAALAQVPRAKRPPLNPELFDAYAEWYPKWTIALCCFNNTKARLADPMLWWYQPMNPKLLFLPALDCHTGNTPDLEAKVWVDHVVVVGSDRMSAGHKVKFRDAVPAAVSPYLRPAVRGQAFHEEMPNGDFVLDIVGVRNSLCFPKREKPPGANRA